MRRRPFALAAFVTQAALLLAPAGAARQGPFVENRGQWPREVLWRREAGAAATWIVADGFWLTLEGGDESRQTVALRFRFPRAAGSVTGEAPVEGRRHYLIGPDPARWGRDALASSAVRWGSIAPGVDAVARAGRVALRYDLELAPGADPGTFAVSVEGGLGLGLGPAGELVVQTALGPVVQRPPLAWQPAPDGARRPVPARFVLLGANRFGFEVNDRDRGLPLVIDPDLVWTLFVGGSVEDEVLDLVLAPGGDVLVCGRTQSFDFPTTPGVVAPFESGQGDGFVARFSPDGQTLRWATYLGGFAFDAAKGIDLAAGEEPVVCGDTFSPSFPATAGSFGPQPGGHFDAFVARLTADGSSLVWAGFLGGNLLDRGNDVAVAPDDSATVVGTSNGGSFPTTWGAHQRWFGGGVFGGDGFCARVDPSGAFLQWSTFLGGSGDDVAQAVEIDSGGDADVVGFTTSTAWKVTANALDPSWNGGEDAFLVRVFRDGSYLDYSSYLGGPDNDRGLGLALGAAGRVAVVGQCDGPGFPTSANAFQPQSGGGLDGFVASFSQGGTVLDAASYLGGEADDVADSVVADGAGALVVAGSTASAAFPVTPGAFDTSFNGSSQGPADAFLSRWIPGQSALSYSTYLGGTEDEQVGGLAWAGGDEVVVGGRTSSASFPKAGSTVSPSYNQLATANGFVSRFGLRRGPVVVGQGKAGSIAFPPQVFWLGFPSLADADFQIGLHTAVPFQPSVVFTGIGPANLPWLGGTLYCQPPVRRLATFQNDFVGFGAAPIAIDATMVGTEIRYQVWSRDPGASFGAIMTAGLDVLYHP